MQSNLPASLHLCEDLLLLHHVIKLRQYKFGGKKGLRLSGINIKTLKYAPPKPRTSRAPFVKLVDFFPVCEEDVFFSFEGLRDEGLQTWVLHLLDVTGQYGLQLFDVNLLCVYQFFHDLPGERIGRLALRRAMLSKPVESAMTGNVHR